MILHDNKIAKGGAKTEICASNHKCDYIFSAPLLQGRANSPATYHIGFFSKGLGKVNLHYILTEKKAFVIKEHLGKCGKYLKIPYRISVPDVYLNNVGV